MQALKLNLASNFVIALEVIIVMLNLPKSKIHQKLHFSFLYNKEVDHMNSI